MKKLSDMTDEERYGKVGAEIRRLDPEAYKNRPRSMEGNLKLLKELRAKNKEAPKESGPSSSRKMSVDEFIEGYKESPASGRMRQGAYYRANPEPGLGRVDEEMFSPGAKMAAGAAGATAVAYGAKKLLDRFRRKGMERRGKDLAEKDVPSDAAREAARKAAQDRRVMARREKDYDERLSSDMAGGYRKGGRVKKYAGGGAVSSRADGIAKRGKTRCRIV